MYVKTALAVALLAALIEPSSAREQVVTAEVRYADLDLTTPAGFAALDRRVRHVAVRLCLGSGLPGQRSDRLPEPRCLASAVASVRDQVDRAIARRRATARLTR